MELGNLLFGNSRGKYSMPRGKGFEEELVRLFDVIDPGRDNSWREYGVEYENEVFFTMPYYWGECTCGYNKKEAEWLKKHDHRPDCYQKDWEKLEEEYALLAIPRSEIKKLYEKHDLEWNGGYGCAVICTCDYQKKWEEFLENNQHNPGCLKVKPNFLYKPTGFQIQWYKYPLRDSYTNQRITLREFRKIINHCIESVWEKQDEQQNKLGSP